jgi:hypothetical protein
MNRTSLNEDSLLEPSKNLPNHFFLNLRNKMTHNKYLIYMFQIFGLILMLFVILIPRTLQQGGTWPQPLHSLYLSFGKVVFVMGMFSSVLPSLLDVPNFTFFIMDTKFFNFISKISFWTYLIHYMVVMQIVYRQKIDFYFKIGDIMPLYFPTVIISLFFGFIGTITVEVPFAKM